MVLFAKTLPPGLALTTTTYSSTEFVAKLIVDASQLVVEGTTFATTIQLSGRYASEPAHANSFDVAVNVTLSIVSVVITPQAFSFVEMMGKA